jgi:hypothetical protein
MCIWLVWSRRYFSEEYSLNPGSNEKEITPKLAMAKTTTIVPGYFHSWQLPKVR